MERTLVFESAPEGPPRRTRTGGGQGGASLFQPLVDAAYAEPGVWFVIDCDGNANKAAARAESLRKNYGLEATTRKDKVYARLAPNADSDGG